MFLSLTCPEALQEIADAKLIFDEIFVPKECPPASHSPYLPEYEWLFITERKLARFLDPWLKSYRPELIGSGGMISEALSNAYCHAHKRNARLPIQVTIYEGKAGLLLKIKDAGEGFDIDGMVSKFLSNKNYFYNAGNGTKCMFETKNFGIFYAENGTAFHLMYLFDAEGLSRFVCSKNERFAHKGGLLTRQV
ncbi:MAG: hypothetical protein C0622_06205 [Desulfuromonas sp.]|mgnify:CR=1 FL=1|nr:MAG: hypothetical protein C0622_06205 [Desulfuromonas sp.]